MQEEPKTDRRTGSVRPETGAGQPPWHDQSEEDIEEGMDRMMNEGGGVVNHYLDEDIAVHRNELVDVGNDENPGSP
ncbi:MAG: hypothetical protein IRY98_01360 [Alicyclobacillaceae bacterium]|nr:hypothetical protein [Alicyclobacillaceae bacterium]